MRRHARAQSRLSRLTRSCTEPSLGSEDCPSVYDCYRFATKLREHKHLLDAYVVRVLSGLRAVTPDPDVVVGGSASRLCQRTSFVSRAEESELSPWTPTHRGDTVPPS